MEKRVEVSRLTPRGERTRARLVAAARVVFERDGFGQARIADIATGARTAIGSFYTYFATKEEIFRAVVDAVDADIAAPLPPEVGADPLERVEAGTRAYVRKYKENARLLAALQHRTLEDPEIDAIRRKIFRRWIARAERSIIRLKNEGRVPPDVNPRFAATVLTGMVHSFCYEAFVFGEDGGLDEAGISKGLATIWARAIGIEPGPRRKAKS